MNLSDFYDTIRQIAEVQAKRRANWNDNAPIDAELEEKHQKELDELRSKLP